MNKIQQLVTDHIDIWTAADSQKKLGRGRSSNNDASVYGIKKLRELILDLAVRGKLIPQDVNDEPASELLKRIQIEKAKVIGASKINKNKSLPQITDNKKMFTLPNGWIWAFIPQVISNDKYAIKRGPFGSSIKKTYFVSSGYKVYEQQHAINDDFSLGNYYLNETKFNELKAFSLKPNDIIISCSGTVGKVAIAPSWMEPGIINQALLKLTLNENVLTNTYFKILFPAFYMKTETLSDLKGTAQKNMVSVDVLKTEPFPLPPLAEQHRIVAKVDELMALCDQLENQHNNAAKAHEKLVKHLLSTLTQSQNTNDFSENWQRIAAHFDILFTTESSIDSLKETLLQLAIMGKLVPQDPNDEPASELLKRIQAKKITAERKPKKINTLTMITDEEKPFELPHGWEWTTLASTCLINPRNNVEDDLPVSFVPMTMIGTMFNSSHDQETRLWKEIRQGFTHFAEGDIGIAKITPCFENSKACVFSGLLNGIGAGTTELHIIRPIKETIAPRYILAFLKSPGFLLLGETKMTGTAGQKRLPKDFVESNPFPLPPLNEQHRIVAKLDELNSLCDQLKSRITEAKHIQQKLSDAMVEQAIPQ